MELPDHHLHRVLLRILEREIQRDVAAASSRALRLDELTQDVVFQPPQREVALRQEIAAAAGGVKQDAVSDTM